MSRVVTYRLAYSAGEVDLCDHCVERGDHDAGPLGPVAHGEHRGECEGRRHDDDTAQTQSLVLCLLQPRQAERLMGAAATAGGWIAVDGDIRDTVSWAVRDDRYDPRATPDILALLPSEWMEATPIAKAQAKRILDQIDRMARGDEDALAASRARHADIAARLRTHLAM